MDNFISDEDENTNFTDMYEQTNEGSNFIVDMPRDITDDSNVRVVKPNKVSYNSNGMIRLYPESNLRHNFKSDFYNPVVKDSFKVKSNKFIISR